MPTDRERSSRHGSHRRAERRAAAKDLYTRSMRADTHSGSALVRAALISGSLVVCFSCAIAAQHSAKLAPDVPMPQDVVERMLAFAGIGDKDVVVDLGSGDGRVVITAATK